MAPKLSDALVVLYESERSVVRSSCGSVEDVRITAAPVIHSGFLSPRHASVEEMFLMASCKRTEKRYIVASGVRAGRRRQVFTRTPPRASPLEPAVLPPNRIGRRSVPGYRINRPRGRYSPGPHPALHHWNLRSCHLIVSDAVQYQAIESIGLEAENRRVLDVTLKRLIDESAELRNVSVGRQSSELASTFTAPPPHPLAAAPPASRMSRCRMYGCESTPLRRHDGRGPAQRRSSSAVESAISFSCVSAPVGQDVSKGSRV
ncbi:hypothetical protein F2P81_025000 [Scophthalmus maximus]|uniref:Uncharacterized protein n=1 Tax=Scophthalmus maximus TaxID=52904 RepID=A0A6A4RRW1_SCOMX|nr:hypothetical protein F2P81_025000 [Scophthalmus maximus]